MVLRELPSAWRALAQQQQELGADAQARTLEWCANALEAAVRHVGGGLLSIRQAAVETGLNEETLRRMVRDGRLPAERASAKGRIRLRRRDLPARPQRSIESNARRSYNPEEDARNIAQLLEGQK